MSLGFWIIMLTIIVKLLLLAPSQKALHWQKAMQKIQPDINKVKEKYKWDQQKIAVETMKIWKKNWTNPFWSCLPLLIQFPILIAIFFIIKDWLTENSAYLLYPYFSGFDYSLMETNFLWILDLAKIDIFVLPVIVWGLQYFQMHLSFKWQENKKWSNSSWDMMQQQMQMMSKMMKYFMPLMIAIFTANMPSAIWLYWWVSTLFSIIQQIFVNKNSDIWNKKSHLFKFKDKNKKNKKDYEDVEIVSRNEAKLKDWITKIKI